MLHWPHCETTTTTEEQERSKRGQKPIETKGPKLNPNLLNVICTAYPSKVNALHVFFYRCNFFSSGAGKFPHGRLAMPGRGRTEEKAAAMAARGERRGRDSPPPLPFQGGEFFSWKYLNGKSGCLLGGGPKFLHSPFSYFYPWKGPTVMNKRR